MQFELHADGSLTELPQQNIDTGLGLDRMAAIMQDVPSVFETDLFAPLIEFGEQRSGRTSGQDFATTRALRILADHGRGATFLMADGVVPSNEDRGYILRRILRRAIQQGRRLGIADGFVPDLCQVVIDKMGEPYPQLHEERDTIMRWAAAEEEGFGRTLAQGERLLADLIAKARSDGAQAIPAEEAFRLHDTFGFPFELTTELLAEQGLGVDEEGFAGLMEQARVVARGAGPRRGRGRACASGPSSFAKSTGFTTNFVGYESTEAETVLRAVERDNGTHPGQARGQPVLRRGRRPGVRRRRWWRRPAGARGWPRCCAWAATRRWRWSRSRATWSRASGCTPWSSATRAWPRCATTPPRTCCTPRCASGWAPTCARPAPTWAPTSCASTSPTASACPRTICARSRSA